jgi:hypothetical protein
MNVSAVRAFSGSLDVLDGDFTIDSAHLILREDEVVFDLGGHEEYGSFKFSGSAPRDGSTFR